MIWYSTVKGQPSSYLSARLSISGKDYRGRFNGVIQQALNQLFRPRCQPNGTSKRRSRTACRLCVRVTASDKTCIRLLSRVRSWIRCVACVHKFVPVCVCRVYAWDSWPRVRVSVCACIEVGVRGNGKGSRGTITEPRFRATTRRHPFNFHPPPPSFRVPNQPAIHPLLHLLLSSSLLPSHASLVEALWPSRQTDKDVN